MGCICLGLIAIDAYLYSKRPSSYESQFHDEITITFPQGHDSKKIDSIQSHIDTALRESKTGYFSGVMSGGGEIDFMTIQTDFDVIDEKRFMMNLVVEEALPKDVTITYMTNNDLVSNRVDLTDDTLTEQ